MGISSFGVNKPALGGGLALMGVGAAAFVAGVAICSFAAASVVRGRLVQWQQDSSLPPPTELAQHHLKRAAAATGASVNAWRNGIPEQTSTE
jgi:hypothetical protein